MNNLPLTTVAVNFTFTAVSTVETTTSLKNKVFHYFALFMLWKSLPIIKLKKPIKHILASLIPPTSEADKKKSEAFLSIRYTRVSKKGNVSFSLYTITKKTSELHDNWTLTSMTAGNAAGFWREREKSDVERPRCDIR